MLRQALAAASAALYINASHAETQSPDAAGLSDAYPQVLTPTRLKQSLQDVPASVTILTASTLATFGITNIPDALRLVPGMEVTQTAGNDYRINYHGTNILSPRRMNVLIDGVSVYQPAFARVDWKNLPVTIDDIDRIEVTRGTDSAAYGPNSLLGIINIITKHPRDVDGAYVSATAGSQETSALTARYGWTVGNTAVRLAANKERDGGFDSISRGGNHDSTDLDRISLRAQSTLDPSLSFDVDAGYVSGAKDIPFVEQYETSYPDQRLQNYYLTGTLTKSFTPTHQVQVQGTYWSNQIRQDWSSCPFTGLLIPQLFALYQVNPAYADALVARRRYTSTSAAQNTLAAAAAAALARLGARALQPTCVTTNQNTNEKRFSLELQDTYILSDQLRAVSGFGVRQEQGVSDTFLDGSVTQSTYWGFINAEYKPTVWLSVNAGAYLEHDDLSRETSASPRLAANVRLSAQQTVRFVWSTGTRTPDIQEERSNWTYNSTDAVPPLNGSSTVRFYQSGVSQGGLSSEKIESREIGYLFNAPSLGLLIDTKIFDDRLRDLISEKLSLSTFTPTNDGSVRLTGAEVQADIQLIAQWTAFANFAYLQNRDPSNITEQTQYSKYSGAAGLARHFNNGLTAAVAYYGNSGNGVGETSYGREDLTVTKIFRTNPTPISLSLILRRLDNPTVTYFLNNASISEAVYDRRLQIFGQIKASF